MKPLALRFPAASSVSTFGWIVPMTQRKNEVTDRCNAEGSDTLTSIASKLEIYAVRFSLLLALADRACGDEKKLIDADIVERAIRLTEYFRVTAAKVQGIVIFRACSQWR